MQLNEWLGWYKNLKFELKWFVVVVLLRPILEGFYGLKETSILVSPLYWLGIGVPVLIIWTILIKYRKPEQGIPGSRIFKFFGVLLILSVVLLILRDPGISSIQTTLRVTSILFLFAYAARYLTDWRDIDGVLIACLISTIYPLLMMMYEILGGPINVEMSRGLERIHGLYADSFSYSIYLMLSVIIILHFHRSWRWLNYRFLLPFFAIVLLGLYHLNHIASWAAFVVVLGSRIISSARLFIGIILAGIVLAPFLLQKEFDSDVVYESKLLGKEYEVLSGVRPIEQGFHGRVTRWQYYGNLLRSAAPTVWLLGIYSDFDIYPQTEYVLVAPHNDFLRILLLTGVPGLLSYLFFLASALKSASGNNDGVRFIKYAAIAVTVMYSVSALPTIYASLMSIILPIVLAKGDSRTLSPSSA